MGRTDGHAGEPRTERHLAMAVRELERQFPGARFSPWYRNRAVGFEGEDFINFVAGFPTELPVDEVLQRLHAIEVLCGRPREALDHADLVGHLDPADDDDERAHEVRF